MRSYQALSTVALAFTVAALLAGGCGSDEAKWMMNPTQPGSAGTGVAPTIAVAGSAARPPVSAAGSGAAGTGVAARGSAAGTTAIAGAGAAGPAASGAPTSASTAGTAATAGPTPTGGAPATTGASGGAVASAGTGGGSVPMGAGMCCATGNCLCHGPDPMGLTSMKGPFTEQTIRASTGTIHYPTNAEPPFAGVAVCGGFLNTGPEMDSWGSFYASHGIVTIVTSTGASDQPNVRATKLLGAIKTLKDENTKPGSALMGKMSDRYGTSGYSMGGGGTTIATGMDATLKTSVGMAPWGGQGANVKTATLLFCGSSDTTAPCSMASSVFRGIADPTPKMLVTLNGTSHLQWVGSYSAPGQGAAAKLALAFQKVFLEGDERWKPLLKMMTTGESSAMSANVN